MHRLESKETQNWTKITHTNTRRGLIFSMLVDVILFISSTDISPSVIVFPLRPEGMPPWDKLYLFVSVVNNSIFDILSIIAVRWLTKSVARIPAIYIVPLLISSVGIAFVVFLLASISQNFMLVIVYSRFYDTFPNVEDLQAAYIAARATLVFSSYRKVSLIICTQCFRLSKLSFRSQLTFCFVLLPMSFICPAISCENHFSSC